MRPGYSNELAPDTPGELLPDKTHIMDERKKKRIETAIAWVGYSIAFIGLIALLLSLVVRP